MTKDSRRQVPRHLLALVACGGLALLAAQARAQSLDTQRADIAAFIADVSQRQGFDPEALTGLFAKVESAACAKAAGLD